MGGETGELRFAVDENSTGLLKVLEATRAPRLEFTTDLPSLGIENGTLDPEVLIELGKRGRFALILRDGKMLGPILQREAWKASGVTLFLLSKSWGKMPLFGFAQRFLFLWPAVIEIAASSQGEAWRVSPAMPDPFAKTFRRVVGQHATI